MWLNSFIASTNYYYTIHGVMDTENCWHAFAFKLYSLVFLVLCLMYSVLYFNKMWMHSCFFVLKKMLIKSSSPLWYTWSGAQFSITEISKNMSYLAKLLINWCYAFKRRTWFCTIFYCYLISWELNCTVVWGQKPAWTNRNLKSKKRLLSALFLEFHIGIFCSGKQNLQSVSLLHLFLIRFLLRLLSPITSPLCSA